MTAGIYVINPNSLIHVTDAIRDALAHIPTLPGIRLECLTLHEGPPGIQTQRDADAVILPLCQRVTELEHDAASFVLACFSDPGLHAVRETTRKPVFGIGEAAMFSACMRGQRIGVIAVGASSIPRHMRYFASMGLQHRVVRERAAGFTVAEVADPARSLQRLIEVGRQLRDEDGADVVVLGCAGMAAMQEPMEDALGIPVVEPCRAAAGMAIGRLLAAAPWSESA